MKINDIRIAKKDLQISKKIYFKSYLTGIFFSLLIMVIPILIIINLSIFYSLTILIHCLIALAIISFMFFILYFKDKALEIYVIGYKDIEYKKLRLIFMGIFSVIIILIVFVFYRSFRWW